MRLLKPRRLFIVLAAFVGIVSLFAFFPWTTSYRSNTGADEVVGGLGSRRHLSEVEGVFRLHDVGAVGLRRSGELYVANRHSRLQPNSSVNKTVYPSDHDEAVQHSLEPGNGPALSGRNRLGVASKLDNTLSTRGHERNYSDVSERTKAQLNQREGGLPTSSRLVDGAKPAGMVDNAEPATMVDGAKTVAMVDADATRQCRPHRNLVFWKTHKCGSSTVQNIVFRYAESNDLRIVLPPRSHLFNLVHRFNATRDVPREFVQSTRPFNVFTHHARFSAPDIASLLPQDSHYVTILRSPLTLFESIYDYLGLPGAFGNDTHPLKIKSFLKEPYQYYNTSDTNVHRRYARNPLLYDLGLEPEDMDDLTKVDKTIHDVQVHFHLVMIMEHFDESLVLLKDLMCWTFEDVAYLKLNARERPREVTAYTQNLLQKWNYGDAQLYRHFNRTLWAHVREYGEDRMRADVTRLREVNARLTGRCVKEKTNVDDIEGQESIWHPDGIDILGYQLRESAMNDRTCRNLIKSEKLFTDDIRERQGDYYFPRKFKKVKSPIWLSGLQGPDRKAASALSAMLERMQHFEKRPAR